MLTHTAQLEVEHRSAELQDWIRTNDVQPGSMIHLAPSEAFETFAVTSVLKPIYDRRR